MLTVTAIGGVPGTGKTTLMREIMKRQNGFDLLIKQGLLTRHEYFCSRVAVLGDYSDPDSVFAGTDKLSMAAQPEAITFFEGMATRDADWHVLYEGDRLFTASLLQTLVSNRAVRLRILILNTGPAILAERYKARGSNQSETFLKGRFTKVQNIAQRFNGRVRCMPNENLDDQEKAVEKALNMGVWV